MTSDAQDAKVDRDYTKWIWLGVILVIGVMIFLVWYSGRTSPTISVARVKHILISYNKANPADRSRALERITQLRDRVLKGEDFGKLAFENSTDPGSATRGGDLGYMPRGSMVKSMEDFAWNAPVGKLSDVIASEFGFHIAIVVDRRLSEIDKLAEQQKQAGQTPAAPAPASPDATTPSTPGAPQAAPTVPQ